MILKGHCYSRTGVSKQTTTCRAISSSPGVVSSSHKEVCQSWKNNIHTQNCLFGGMKHILKRSHYVTHLTLVLFCNSLCGLLAKKFGDPCSRNIVRFVMLDTTVRNLLPKLSALNKNLATNTSKSPPYYLEARTA